MNAARIYFHGLPGSPGELELFGQERLTSFDWIPDRNKLVSLSTADDLFRLIANEINQLYPDRQVRLTGFSLGAHTALQVAAHLGDKVEAIDLISAAAPLELGKFLPEMAGKPVFSMARKYPKLFAIMTAFQALMARKMPDRLVGALFASASGNDLQLAGNPQFRRAMAEILKLGLGKSSHVYRLEIAAYVKPWAAILDAISCPVRIWHGTEDNWSPPAMARALHDSLPNGAEMMVLDGLSHYSTLKFALTEMVQNGQRKP